MKKYWDNYYKLSKSPIKPTKFSVFCRKYLKSFKGILYDVGCGNGRDTIYFNKLKIKSIGNKGCRFYGGISIGSEIEHHAY